MKAKTFIGITILLMLTQICWGQDDIEEMALFYGLPMNPQFGGTSTFSMGGVYTSTNQGVEALSGNPAGLALLDGAQFLVGGRLGVTGKICYEDDYYEDVGYDDYSRKFGITPKLLNLGVAFPLTLPNSSQKLVGAVGYRSFYDWATNINIETKREDYSGQTLREATYKTHGLINTLSFGIGTTFSEKYSIGMSFNLPILKGFKYESESEIKTASDKSSYDYEEELDVSGGSFIQFGGIAQITTELTVGLSYTLSHKFEFDDGKWKENDDGSKDNGKISDNTKFEIPSLYSLGISYKVSPDLLIAAEIQNRPWEDYEIDNENPVDSESGSAYRFGLEYGTDVLFRAGFAIERTPLIDADMDPVNMKVLTGGIGYRTTDYLIDFGAAYRFTTFEVEDYYSDTWDYTINEIVVYANFKYFFEFSIGQ